MSDEELEVVVETEEAPVVKSAEVGTTQVQTKDPGEDLSAQFKELQARATADAERARVAEDRANRIASEAAETRRQLQTSRVEVVESNYDTIVTGISAAQAEVAAAEAAYAKAMEDGNWTAAAKAQSANSIAAARLVRLDEAKSDLEVRKEVESRKQEAQPAHREAPSDPVEAFIAAAYRPPQTQAWLREHREFILEPRKQMKLNAAHSDAMAEGFEPNSADYFKHVEGFLGLTKVASGGNGANGANGKTPARRQSAPVAPVNGTGGNGASPGGNVVRLTAGEARAATDGTHVWNYEDPTGKARFKKGEPIGIQEMARRKQAMLKDGLYDKSYTEQ